MCTRFNRRARVGVLSRPEIYYHAGGGPRTFAGRFLRGKCGNFHETLLTFCFRDSRDGRFKFFLALREKFDRWESPKRSRATRYLSHSFFVALSFRNLSAVKKALVQNGFFFFKIQKVNQRNYAKTVTLTEIEFFTKINYFFFFITTHSIIIQNTWNLHTSRTFCMVHVSYDFQSFPTLFERIKELGKFYIFLWVLCDKNWNFQC